MTLNQFAFCCALMLLAMEIAMPYCFPMPERTDHRALPGTGGAVFQQFVELNK